MLYEEHVGRTLGRGRVKKVKAGEINYGAPTSANKKVAAFARFTRSRVHGAERRAGNF
jgi:hypothetical protein